MCILQICSVLALSSGCASAPPLSNRLGGKSDLEKSIAATQDDISTYWLDCKYLEKQIEKMSALIESDSELKRVQEVGRLKKNKKMSDDEYLKFLINFRVIVSNRVESIKAQREVYQTEIAGPF